MGLRLALPEFTLSRTTHARRNIVYEVMSGYEKHPELFGQHFPSVKVRSRRGNVSVAEHHINLAGMELICMVKHVLCEPEVHEMFFIGGHVKGTHIRETFVEVQDATRVTIHASIKLGPLMGVRHMFVHDRFEHDYEQILDDFMQAAARDGNATT